MYMVSGALPGIGFRSWLQGVGFQGYLILSPDSLFHVLCYVILYDCGNPFT